MECNIYSVMLAYIIRSRYKRYKTVKHDSYVVWSPDVVLWRGKVLLSDHLPPVGHEMKWIGLPAAVTVVLCW